jgi:hypothetical protein
MCYLIVKGRVILRSPAIFSRATKNLKLKGFEMKRTLTAAILSVMLIAAASAAIAEQISLKFDDRDWVLGKESEDKVQGIRVYNLKGETPDKWTELITVQAFFGLQLQATPEDYMNGMIKSLKDTCHESTSGMIRKGTNDIMFEWQMGPCSGQESQAEINRILAGDQAMYVVHYATKTTPLDPATKDKWTKLLDSIDLSND